jgi:hypothetical protein
LDRSVSSNIVFFVVTDIIIIIVIIIIIIIIMTSPFLLFPPLFQWPLSSLSSSSNDKDSDKNSFQYYYYYQYSSSHQEAAGRRRRRHRHLFDQEFLERDCATQKNTNSDDDGVMTIASYPPGTAVDDRLGTYLTNYLVAGVALVGAMLVFRQIVTIRRRRRRHPPIPIPIPCTLGNHLVPPKEDEEEETSTTATTKEKYDCEAHYYYYYYYCIQRRRGIVWYLLWFAISYGVAGVGHQFRTNSEPGPGHFDADFAWTERIAYAANLLSIPGLILGLVSTTWLTCNSSSSSSGAAAAAGGDVGIRDEDYKRTRTRTTTTTTTNVQSRQQQLQQQRHFRVSLIWLILASAGAIYIFLADLDQVLFLTGVSLLVVTICLFLICSLAAIVGAAGGGKCCGGFWFTPPQEQQQQQRSNNTDDTLPTSRLPWTEDAAASSFSSSSSSSSLNPCTSFLFAMSQGTIATAIAVQATLSPLCASKEAYQDCFVDCPLGLSEWNHNSIYHMVHGAGILLVIAGALLLPQ